VKKREIRAGTVAGPAGVGAVIDVGTESFVIPGIKQWGQKGLRILDLRRLSARLHKTLKAPSQEGASLVVKRFPRSMFCEKCRRLVNWRTEMEKEGEEPTCAHNGCNGSLVPMRFVVACEHGHLDDFPWGLWAHSGNNSAHGCRSYDKLKFIVDDKAGTGGLGSLFVRCDVCGSQRSLEKIVSKDEVKNLLKKCTGRHPWIFGTVDNCGEVPQVLQRGATNLHYPITVSALDIPETDAGNAFQEYVQQVTDHSRYARLKGLKKNTEGSNAEYLEIVADAIARDVGCAIQVVLDIADADLKGTLEEGDQEGQQALDQAMLLSEEWNTITNALAQGGMTGPYFRALAEPLDPDAPKWASRAVSGILLIERLREVRAYLGFQRVKPGDTDKTIPPDVGGPQNWVPAIEVFGEGIVLAFDFSALKSWRASLPTREAEELARLEAKRIDENFWFLPPVDPIFIALHSLSHLLLRRITFECGYSSSSLRERLYVDTRQEHAGIMIYTADGDSEGSLGGLVRQGRQDRLAQSLYEAVEHGRWCSADPVCSETAGQGLGGFNRASCHACLLVSETSCTSLNTLLDRRLLLDAQWGLIPYLEQNT